MPFFQGRIENAIVCVDVLGEMNTRILWHECGRDVEQNRNGLSEVDAQRGASM